MSLITTALDQDFGVIFEILLVSIFNPFPNFTPISFCFFLSVPFIYITVFVFVLTSILFKSLWLPERNDQTT